MKQIDNSFLGKIFSSYCGRVEKPIFLLFILLIPLVLNGQKFSISVSFDINNFKIEKVDSFNTIHCGENKELRYLLPAGNPKLPYIPFFVLLPHNSRIESTLIYDSDFESIKGDFNIMLTSFEDNDSDFENSANSHFLNTDNTNASQVYYPSDTQIIRYYSPELYAGFLINKIYICPFKYFPETKQLFFYTKFMLDIQYQIDEKPLKYELSTDKIKLSREFIRDIVINKEEIDKTVPLEEKIDYSKIKIYKETEDNPVKEQEVSSLKKAEKTKPFYIKRLKTR
jgi:hypothetical protein